MSGRTILRWVQKFGLALSEEIRRYRKPLSPTWLVDETYVKILGRWHCPCAMRLFPALDALQPVGPDFVHVSPVGAPCSGGRSYVRARHIAAVINRLGQALWDRTTDDGRDQTPVEW